MDNADSARVFTDCAEIIIIIIIIILRKYNPLPLNATK